MSEGLSVGGLASGLDTNAIIDGLVQIELSRVKRVEDKQEDYNLTLSAWGTLETNLQTLARTAADLEDPDKFDKFKISSTNEEIATIKGRDGGTPGSFNVGVYQTARAEKMMSDTFASQVAALGLSGEFTVNRTREAEENDPLGEDVTITIEAGDALKDIRDKINSADDIGISSAIIKMAENEYGLVLTSKDTGAAGADYTETVGTVLQDMGILTAAGDKGNVAHKVESTHQTAGGTDMTETTLLSALDGAGVAVNDTVTIGGIDRNGNALNQRQFVISDLASTTVGDFLEEIEKTFNGMVSATVENGRIMIEDKTAGNSQLQVELTANNEGGGSLDWGGVQSVNTVGQSGALQAGQDAFFNVDNIFFQNEKNQADDSIEGITVMLRKADVDENVQVSMERDLDGIKANIQKFLDSFNSIIKFIDEKSKVTVTEKGDLEKTEGETDEIDKSELAGDSTAYRLKNELRNVLTRQMTELVGSSYQSLASIGIISNRNTGEYEIDDEKFDDSLEKNYNDVKALFVNSGVTDNASFIYGRSTEETKSGRYRIDVDNASVSKLDENDNVLETWDADISGQVLTVNAKGDAKGLSVTVPSSGNSILTLSKGVARELTDYVGTITDRYDGFITKHKEGIQDRIDDLDERIFELQERAENYRQKLVNEFADLEQTMQKLQSQNQAMLSQLGM